MCAMGRYRASLIARKRAPTTLSAQALLRTAPWPASLRITCRHQSESHECRSALVREGRYRASLIARERAPTTLSAHALPRTAPAQASRRGPHPASTRMNVGAHLCAMGRYWESLIARERAPTPLQAQPSCATNSASCTALSAAPLRILSETIHRFRPRGCERSSRMRPTNTASWPEACVTGVG